jgi:hypothetical protein
MEWIQVRGNKKSRKRLVAKIKKYLRWAWYMLILSHEFYKEARKHRYGYSD